MLNTVMAFCNRHDIDYPTMIEELARQRLASEPRLEEVLTTAHGRIRQRATGDIEQPAEPDQDRTFPP